MEESTEHEVRSVQDMVFKQQEIEISGRVKSSLPPIHGKMPLNDPANLVAEIHVPLHEEKKKQETPAEREARLKMQRDVLLARKKADRETAFKEYIAEGGTDLSVKAKPSVSAEELEKRKQILTRIKTYHED